MKLTWKQWLVILAVIGLAVMVYDLPTLAQTAHNYAGEDNLMAIDDLTSVATKSGQKVYNFVYTVFGIGAVVFTGYNGGMWAFGDERHKNKCLIGIAAIVVFVIVMAAIKKIFHIGTV